ncbi:MAG: sulfite exporter TauE/SafE family protein [Desulfobacterium sp.]|jgi:sulfite exporter TauE/SafE|nr:sulfite exporter TauE/SafE family protein [Desulfobacterium sp.]
MEASSLLSLFLLGLSGTGHCLGMCGPLVLAFPGKSGKFDSHLCYHAGRIITYTVIGLLMGSLGLALAKLVSVTGLDYLATLARIQLVFSLVAGVFLALFGLGQLGILGQSDWLIISNPQIIPGYRFIVRSAFQRSDRWLMVVTGMFMGFIPCGLSFAAFSRALAASGPMEGGLFLLAFGLGTLPGLLLLGTGASVIARRYRRHFDLFSGMLMIGMAASLLLDGIAALF